MSVRFGDIDLNSDVVNDGVHGVNTSESTVGFNGRDSEGLGFVEKANGAGAEMGRLEREKVENSSVMGVGGQIGVDDCVIGLGLNCNFLNSDTFCGVSTRSVNCDDVVEKNFSEGLGSVEKANGTGAEMGQLEPEKVESASVMGVGGHIGVDDSVIGLGLNGNFQNKDTFRGVSTRSENSNEGSEKNSRVLSEEIVVDRGEERVCVGNDVEGEVAAVSGEDIQIENVKHGSQEKGLRIEKESQFHVSDLVWAKVKSHPWWPGQIFDPSDASEKARRYSKRDGFLIAYFGDKTFAWNEASLIKSFRMHFSQMEKQSSTEAFSHAVDCALEEVSRRVEFGLACSCSSLEVYNKIKTQTFVNSGIREESSRRVGGDESLSAASFMPVNILKNVKAAAQHPFGGIDRLEFVIARAQLLAISRWKGFCCLPEFQMLGGTLEDGANIPVTGQSKYSEGSVCVNEQFPLRKGKLVIQDTSSRKRKEISGDGVSSSKKERCLSDLMSRTRGRSNLSDGKGEPEVLADSYLNSSSSVKKRKALDPVPDVTRVENEKVSPSTKKQFSRVGESICRVANQLAMSSPIGKDGSRIKKGENRSSKRYSRSKSGKFQRKKINPTEYSSPDEMLSQIYVASRDPVKGYNFLASSVGFLSEFRNSFCLEKSASREDKKPTADASSKKSGENLCDAGTTGTPGFGGTEDSYWTDMIVQSNTGEQVLFEPGIPKKNDSPAVAQEATLESGQGLELKQETEVINPEAGTQPEGEEEYTPTAFILNFADLESVPSVSNLNDIFCRYGPLVESDTEVLKKSKRAKVVFKRRSDAETAFSPSGKFSIFGPSLVSYRLNLLPSTPRKSSTSTTKRSKRGATSVEGNSA